MLTSLGGHDTEALRHAGIQLRLTKPVKPAQLYEALTSLLAGAAAPRLPSRPAAEVSPKSARILVAEDNPVNQRVILLQLQRLGYAADAVGNGLEALDALERIDYDIVLMDCQMPEMDGYEAARRIRSREASRAHTPIVAMTAHALAGDREKCLESGMDDYITKPVKVPELSATLARWCEIVSATTKAFPQGVSSAAIHP
jgi:CheY-like chemotaxis protein